MTILSCDNVPGNGDVARAAIIAVAERHGVELVRYVEMCTFPNSMVDRITPQTRDADREWLRDEVGVDDAWPVICERFRQWVVEDRFAVGRPRWEDAGVLFTDRVHASLEVPSPEDDVTALLAALAPVSLVGALIVAWTQLRR